MSTATAKAPKNETATGTGTADKAPAKPATIAAGLQDLKAINADKRKRQFARLHDLLIQDERTAEELEEIIDLCRSLGFNTGEADTIRGELLSTRNRRLTNQAARLYDRFIEQAEQQQDEAIEKYREADRAMKQAKTDLLMVQGQQREAAAPVVTPSANRSPQMQELLAIEADQARDERRRDGDFQAALDKQLEAKANAKLVEALPDESAMLELVRKARADAGMEVI